METVLPNGWIVLFCNVMKKHFYVETKTGRSQYNHPFDKVLQMRYPPQEILHIECKLTEEEEEEEEVCSDFI